jgi:tRNA (guanine6-N2)-methyltransferase
MRRPRSKSSNPRKTRQNRPPSRKGSSTPIIDSTDALYELEFAPGLEEIVEGELQELDQKAKVTILRCEKGELSFTSSIPTRRLLELRTAISAYTIAHFDIPRPRALLGDKHVARLLSRIERVMKLWPQKAQTFRFGAAGSDSEVFTRLAELLNEKIGLKLNQEEGDLLIRIRPTRVRETGWDILLRLSPRPLATRAYRVADYPGALNAALAAAMVRLSDPRPGESFFNPMCGSGTLLIERSLVGNCGPIVGMDVEARAIEYARRNVTAAGQEIDLIAGDVLENPPSNIFDVVCCDLPWGERHGQRADNVKLYGRFIEAMERCTRPGTRMLLLTQDANALISVLQESTIWKRRLELKVFQGGFHPTIFVLGRVS